MRDMGGHAAPTLFLRMAASFLLCDCRYVHSFFPMAKLKWQLAITLMS
jgi:hypothetical protein